MNFKPVLFCLLGLLHFNTGLQSQAYLQISIPNESDYIQQVADLGVALDHVFVKENMVYLIVNQFDIQQIRRTQIPYNVILEDAEVDRKSAINTQRSRESCGPELSDRILTPANYIAGSVLGQYTYDEMIDQLEAMRIAYPNLISGLMEIGRHRTEGGKPIHVLRISDNPDLNEDNENEILYTSLHHAREPMSMHQMIFYMWYLLENYETDSRIKYLVDNLEMYFVPCVNPDGYIYNMETMPGGGGLWRKNRRDNGNGTYGVDLNRNYGFEWAHDNSGSSSSQGSEVYRGPSPFSEPETQAIRDLCNSHDFQIAMNYHSFGNFLIYPYGFTEEAPPEAEVLEKLAIRLTKTNQYIYGTGLQTVQYFTNGDADDWMFGERSTKDLIYPFTPEVGSFEDYFWPDPSRILPLAKENVQPNLAAASFLLDPANVFDLTPPHIGPNSDQWSFRIEKLGFADVALQLRITPLTENIQFGLPNRIFLLGTFGTQEDAFEFTLDPDIGAGERIAFELEIDNGLFKSKKVIEKFYQIPELEYRNDGQSSDFVATGWLSQWGRSNQEFYTAPASFADSPFGNYLPNSVNEFSTLDKIFIPAADSVQLQFWTKWDIEPGQDFAQVLISTDDQNFEPLCGKYTVQTLNINNAEGEPAYVSSQKEWVLESIDLSPFMGQLVRLRYFLLSNGDNTRDGMYIDDIEVVAYQSNVATSTTEVSFETVNIYPNPATTSITIAASNPLKRWKLSDVLGSEIRSGETNDQTLNLDISSLSNGTYIFQTELGLRRQVVVHK